MQGPRWRRTERLKFLAREGGTWDRYEARVVLTSDELVDGRLCPGFFGTRLATEAEAARGMETLELMAENVGRLAVELLAKAGYGRTRVSRVDVWRRDGKESVTARWD